MVRGFVHFYRGQYRSKRPGKSTELKPFPSKIHQCVGPNDSQHDVTLDRKEELEEDNNLTIDDTIVEHLLVCGLDSSCPKQRPSFTRLPGPTRGSPTPEPRNVPSSTFQPANHLATSLTNSLKRKGERECQHLQEQFIHSITLTEWLVRGFVHFYIGQYRSKVPGKSTELRNSSEQTTIVRWAK